ncbi:hypothetical protein BaRGS_00000287 [Batillaria attramentaria]|uniref:Uncharacterized protein n=1 Tax=Batillaria attramentaria TaxID=370345 RepID=A0ABD0MCA9_9CAEN
MQRKEKFGTYYYNVPYYTYKSKCWPQAYLKIADSVTDCMGQKNSYPVIVCGGKGVGVGEKRAQNVFRMSKRLGKMILKNISVNGCLHLCLSQRERMTALAPNTHAVYSRTT